MLEHFIDGITFGMGFALMSVIIEKGIPLLYKKAKRKRRKAKKLKLKVIQGGANG